MVTAWQHHSDRRDTGQDEACSPFSPNGMSLFYCRRPQACPFPCGLCSYNFCLFSLPLALGTLHWSLSKACLLSQGLGHSSEPNTYGYTV